ncbi:aminotransferase-like domain-containing protein [Chitinilyticum litopenaei]|uniref:aminotransferase-like domain-containing protein n=1 Tax=Chitinilyticum litopenaei TaxID=1121276 RepID=UPI0003FC5C5B|nr:PLP-dependent aminotransferase family protein [Chitinilyticum litopenaei]
MLAQRISRLTSSLVRDILAAASQPDVISFAGGLPAEDALFVPDAAGLAPERLRAALQYGPSEGELRLRELVAQQLNSLGLSCGPQQVLILNGSQQGIDLMAKLLIEPGRRVLVEAPAYLAALQAFRLFGAELDGWSRVEGISAEAKMKEGLQADTCMTYLTPTFQNPSGACYSAAERRGMAAVLDAHPGIVFEDDPYRDLAYDGPAPAPLVSHLRAARWVYQGSFSKILAPGLRLGFLVAHPELFPHLLRLKQAADLHSNRLSQLLVTQVLEDGLLAGHLARILPDYRARRDVMAASLDRHLGGLASWTLPAGGLFFWVKLAQPLDSQSLMQRMLRDERVAIMPGSAFFAQPADAAYLRLNFSHASPERIAEGLARLGRVLRSQRTAS